MRDYKLGFISNEKIFEHVKRTVQEYRTSINLVSLLEVSKATILKWKENGKLIPQKDLFGNIFYDLRSARGIPEIDAMINSRWEEELSIIPQKEYTSIELFAGAGGLALGFEQAGFKHILLNELDSDACSTLRMNRPTWNVIEEDVRKLSFIEYKNKVDIITGGFPCQAFSYAGKQGGFNDTRGTLFFEIARAIFEVKPKVFLCENIKGLTAHDEGKTLQTIRNTIHEIGYTLVAPLVLNAAMYKVPQKRERLVLIGIRNDLAEFATYHYPSPYHRIMTLADAFFSGELYRNDVPSSQGYKYSDRKRRVMEMVPMGGNWKSLPNDIQKDYMGGSYLLGGGKTGIARRLSLYEPSLTLTCSPNQKQTERCHPIETRPLTIREYARIQTFPDEWQFSGSIASQYKQIGNAVPVNFAAALGRSIVSLLNSIEQ